jgi:acyl-CoA thioesterase-2
VTVERELRTVTDRNGAPPGAARAPAALSFEIEPDAGDAVVAVVPATDGTRAFGGHLMALALRAAARTVAGSGSATPPHALQARFLRPGTVGDRVHLSVERVRDGRTTSVRRVLVADLAGRLLVTVEVSFRPVGEGVDWSAPADPLVLPASTQPNPIVTATPLAPFEVRAVHGYTRGGPVRLHPYWARLREPLADDPVLEACMLAVLTDIGVSGSARRPGEPMRVQRNAVTLNHSLWVHRRIPPGAWVLVDVVPETNAGGHAFARGQVRLRDGSAVASFGQEVLLDPA